MTIFVCLLINSMIINVNAIEVNRYLKKQTVSFVFWIVTNHKSLQSLIPSTHSFFLNIRTFSSHLLNIKLSNQSFDALNLASVSVSIPLAICKARSGPRHVCLSG